MRVKEGEYGAALLAILLLVAIVGAIAAGAIEKLALSRAAALNHAATDQARYHADAVGQLALLTLEDLGAQDFDWAGQNGRWNGAVRRVPLPDGGLAEARVRDGGNCFNLNSVVEGDPRTGLNRRASGVFQMVGLMRALDISDADARIISEAAADWADSDNRPGPGGVEDWASAGSGETLRTANSFFADVGEARALRGMTPDVWDRLRPWLCALPTSDLSPINVNSLTPDQAPLLAMLAPDRLSVEAARRVLAGRPRGGWDSPIDFWQSRDLHELPVPIDVQAQPQVRPLWFRIETRVESGPASFHETLLIDARLDRARIVQRHWE